MKKQLLSVLFSFLLVFSVSAQKAQKQTDVEKNLRKHVIYLASEKLEGRRTGEKGATNAAEYVAKMFGKFKLQTGATAASGSAKKFLQPFSYKPRSEKGEVMNDAAPLEAYNVVGILEGNDPVLKNEAVVIGAHYDHLGKGGMGSLAVNSAEIHHGADDNASGVSAMLELARRFAKEKDNKRTLIFIAFGGEEEGLLGSKFYVNNPLFPLDKTVAMINLDMVGRLNENKLTIGGIGTASEWRDLIIRLGSPTPSGLSTVYVIPKTNSFNLQLNEDGFGPSDHSSFYGKQIPVLFFFTGTHSDYHKPSDTFDKINYEGLIRITNFVDRIVRTIDANQTKPTYTVAKSSGMGGGRSGSFSVSLGTVPSYSDGDDTGLVLDGVRDDSPAAKAGIKAGDKIVKLAGRDVKNVTDYVKILGEMKAGEEYEIVIARGAETLTLKIVPAARK